MRYIDFTVNDFAMDEYFQSWVFNSGDESVRNFWESWLLEHPEKRREVAEAKKLLESIRFSQHELPGDEVANLWTRIRGGDSKSVSQVRKAQVGWIYRAAAAIIVIGIIRLMVRPNRSCFRMALLLC
jgi:transmembrane sensor